MIDKSKLSEPNVSSLIYQYEPNVVIYGTCYRYNIKKCYFCSILNIERHSCQAQMYTYLTEMCALEQHRQANNY